MIYAALSVGALVLVVIGGLALWCHSLVGDVSAARDLFDKQVEVTDGIKDERNGLSAQVDALKLSLASTQDRLAVAESQRNALAKKAGEDAATEVFNASPADAAAAVDALLAAPLGVPPAVPEVPGATKPAAANGDLAQGAVQPPKPA